MMRRPLSLPNSMGAVFLLGVTLAGLPTTTRAFGLDLLHAQAALSTPPQDVVSVWIAATGSPADTAMMTPMSVYMDALTAHPLPVKMATGAALAVAGDAIAQATAASKVEEDVPYDTKRATSFAVFDMAYRALQHVTYPIIVNHCHGQYLATIASLLFQQYYLPLDFSAAMERTLSSQLGIVPLLYYPVFFAITAYTQDLGLQGGVDRAKELFVPLMQRNLLFWIPIQFIQFSYVPEDLQIPFVSVCGLAWTCILSVLAGSTKPKSEETTTTEVDLEEPYCVIGSEDGCVVPDDLFPHASLQDIGEELSHDVQVVTQVISHELEEITHMFDNEEDDNDDNNDNVNGQKVMEKEIEEAFK